MATEQVTVTIRGFPRADISIVERDRDDLEDGPIFSGQLDATGQLITSVPRANYIVKSARRELAYLPLKEGNVAQTLELTPIGAI